MSFRSARRPAVFYIIIISFKVTILLYFVLYKFIYIRAKHSVDKILNGIPAAAAVFLRLLLEFKRTTKAFI